MNFAAPVLLIGNGPVDRGAVELVRPFAEAAVAADGGAGTAKRYGLELAAVIGDMDSATPEDLRDNDGKIIRITEQQTTDFEKCLNIINAPLIIGIGFLGGRLDHELAALNALVKADRNIVLIGGEDIVFRLPAYFEAPLPPGMRVSFFPMGVVSGVESKGLEWELNGLQMAPGGLISSSNRVVGPVLQLQNPVQPLLCLLPRAQLAVTLKHFKS